MMAIMVKVVHRTIVTAPKVTSSHGNRLRRDHVRLGPSDCDTEREREREGETGKGAGGWESYKQKCRRAGGARGGRRAHANEKEAREEVGDGDTPQAAHQVVHVAKLLHKQAHAHQRHKQHHRQQ
jgi:hypothetical protein